MLQKVDPGGAAMKYILVFVAGAVLGFIIAALMSAAAKDRRADE